MKVALVDYGVGNLHSLRKGLELAGAQVAVVESPRELEAADAIALPGVGAFGAAMERLEPFRDALLERMRSGTPTLAVCLGMQLLFESSEESPGVPGLGFLKGIVARLPPSAGKVPHMGWTETRWTRRDPAAPAGEHPFYYYVHSFVCMPEEPVTVATANYGIDFPAVVRKDEVLATQFHPEKSSDRGLDLVRRWVAASGA